MNENDRAQAGLVFGPTRRHLLAGGSALAVLGVMRAPFAAADWNAPSAGNLKRQAEHLSRLLLAPPLVFAPP